MVRNCTFKLILQHAFNSLVMLHKISICSFVRISVNIDIYIYFLKNFSFLSLFFSFQQQNFSIKLKETFRKKNTCKMLCENFKVILYKSRLAQSTPKTSHRTQQVRRLFSLQKKGFLIFSVTSFFLFILTYGSFPCWCPTHFADKKFHSPTFLVETFLLATIRD